MCAYPETLEALACVSSASEVSSRALLKSNICDLAYSHPKLPKMSTPLRPRLGNALIGLQRFLESSKPIKDKEFEPRDASLTWSRSHSLSLLRFLCYLPTSHTSHMPNNQLSKEVVDVDRSRVPLAKLWASMYTEDGA